MSSTMTGAQSRRQAQAIADDALEGAEELRDDAVEEVGKLMADVEDLVKKVAHVSDADIARVRQKVEKTLDSTRKSVQQSAARVRAGGRQVADAADGYVHDRPWTALGIAAAVGVVLGVLSARR